MKVLIADDESTSRMILKEALETFGYEVVETSNGKQAWDQYTKEPCGIVVCDWVMPEMDGLALCKKIRSKPRLEYTYFILLTGAMAGDKAKYNQAMSEGVDDFLTKPLDPEALQIRLRVAERILSLNSWVKKLEGILPICTYCKRIRNEEEAYEPIERYVQRHTMAVFSHGICPDCLKRHFPNIAAKQAQKAQEKK